MSIISNNIAAMVVIYNPLHDVLDNISTYINSVDKLYIYDNSATADFETHIPNELKSKIVYFFNGENEGIAVALNFCANKAINDGYKLLLTMDQDSSFSEDAISNYFNAINNFEIDSIGIFSPFHDTNGYRTPSSGKEYEEVLAVMTSGNLVNLEIFKNIGGFLEEFFIDYVDFEYCLRLNSKGYKVIQLNKVLLAHNLGELVTRNFFKKNFSVTNHSPVRLYYRTRNRMYIIQKYYITHPTYSLQLLRLIMADTIKIIFFEKNKREKFKMITIGLIHFFLRRRGKY